MDAREHTNGWIYNVREEKLTKIPASVRILEITGLGRLVEDPAGVDTDEETSSGHHSG